ncbi:uncharacterized protein LOC109802660 [Cajanus cajan]|uniref:uncharacterized protein LOC109802660 n=1 Tax=Cajanus cajan TaxID=3821 RepID=UPI00098DAD98|nr:uncharacterized protein LOC109802660 [Cajanus cajan]
MAAQQPGAPQRFSKERQDTTPLPPQLWSYHPRLCGAKAKTEKRVVQGNTGAYGADPLLNSQFPILRRAYARSSEAVRTTATVIAATANVASSMPSPSQTPPSPSLPCFHCHALPPSHNLEDLPCLQSMTWTMENRRSSPADKVAIITLKLHDYSKSPSGETEVKFQLTRDTLEAMLRSMTYIREQLNAVGTSSGPASKKQKQ